MSELPPTVRAQYSADERVVAAQVWEDFCRVHWPALYEQQQQQQQQQESNQPVSLEDDEYDYFSSLEDSYASSSGSTMRRIESTQW